MTIELIPPQEFLTGRLHLRTGVITDSDIVTLFSRYTGNSLASKYLQRGTHKSTEDTKQMIRACNGHGRFSWIIRTHGDGPIGLVTLIANVHPPELHFGLSPDYWGYGYATEAGNAVMDWIINSSPIKHIRTFCDTEHSACIKVLEKIGFTREDRMTQHLLLPAFGESKRDCWSYSWRSK